jgi:hypothetical protein
MAEPHPVATHNVPSFITAPGETDVLMVAVGLFLALAVVMFGILFFRLHSLPDQIVHKSRKMQAEIVGVLCLVALLTHTHILWLAALLLALIDLPDFGTSLGRIADSTETMAGRKSREGAGELLPRAMTDVKQTDVTIMPREDAAEVSAIRALLRRARSWARGGAAELPPETMAVVKQTDAHEALPEEKGEVKQGNGAVSPQEPPFDRRAPIPLRHVKGS